MSQNTAPSFEDTLTGQRKKAALDSGDGSRINIDLRSATPYLLPPPPPPAATYKVGDQPPSNMAEPFMGFMPFPIQYPPQQYFGQQSPPPPFLPPHPFPPHMIPPHFAQFAQQHFQPYSASSEPTKEEEEEQEGSRSLEALADLSGLLGENYSREQARAIENKIIADRYHRAAGLTAKLFVFVKSVLNELDSKAEAIPYDEVDENYKLSQQLADVMKEWRDMLDKNRECKDEEPPFQFSLEDSAVFGLDDPLIELVLPPYQPPDRHNKKRSYEEILPTPTGDRKLIPGRCLQCDKRETIQWRRGPDGERTLCNACGLFYTKLIRKLGQDLGGKVLRQKKAAGYSADRRVPPALLSDDVIKFYLVEELDTGETHEYNVKYFKDLPFFNGDLDPPRAKKLLRLTPLLEKVEEIVPDVTNMNSKYDPSHEIRVLSNLKSYAKGSTSSTKDTDHASSSSSPSSSSVIK